MTGCISRNYEYLEKHDGRVFGEVMVRVGLQDCINVVRGVRGLSRE